VEVLRQVSFPDVYGLPGFPLSSFWERGQCLSWCGSVPCTSKQYMCLICVRAPLSLLSVNPFLHGVCMLREYIWWVCTRAACKENPNPNPNSHDHCLLSKWKWRTCAHTHLATRQKSCRKRVYRCCLAILRNMTWNVSLMFSVLFCVRLLFPAYHSAKSFSVNLWLCFHRTRSMFRVLPSHDPIHHQLE